MYFTILLKLQYNFSSKSYFMGYRKKRLGDFQMNTFLISSVGCTKSPIIIYVDHQHNEMTFENCDFLVDPA